MRRLWVVSYDIADNQRRNRLAHFLAGWGDRVLESVFECVWRADQMPMIVGHLEGLINVQEDRLWLVPVCQRCVSASEVNGQHRSNTQRHYRTV